MATLNRTAIAAAQIARFGEPMVLADGLSVSVLFDLRAPPAGAQFADGPGALFRVQGQENPSVQLVDVDADGIAKNDRVTVRSDAYIVVDILADGDGMTRIALMPATSADDDALQAHRPWR